MIKNKCPTEHVHRKAPYNDGHRLFIAFILNGLYGSLGNIEAQIGCLDRCNNNIILRKAFGPNEYLNSPKNM